MDFSAELELLLRAKCAFIYLRTTEESRAVRLVREVCEKLERPCYTWDTADGFAAQSTGIPVQSGDDPFEALEQILNGPPTAVYVLPDFHELLTAPKLKRKLRNVAHELTYSRRAIIALGTAPVFSPEMRDTIVTLDLPYPSLLELEDLLFQLEQRSDYKSDLDEHQRTRLVQAAHGLSEAQARRVFSQSLVTGSVIDETDIAHVIQEKRETIKDTAGLEFFPVHETASDVGGLEILKEWLRVRASAFEPAAAQYGLPAIRGVALIGLPGTGKSLCAKLIASTWGLPLLRFDIGSVLGSFVGQSEEQLRLALRHAELAAPCVLWMDEVEKALADEGFDGGVSRRIFGSLLTWMAEKKGHCCVVVTANDIGSLPPEFLRRGRFDEIFFLDLPAEDERTSIFDVHIRKRGRDPKDFAMDQLVAESHGYSGAEIEQALVDAMFNAYSENREVATPDIVSALKRLIPLSLSQREKMTELRKWLLEGRAQSASYLEANQASKLFVTPKSAFAH